MTTFEELRKRLGSHPKKAFGKGATEEEVVAAERALGLSLGGTYRDFLRQFGWGGVAHLEIYGLGRDVPRHLDLVRVTQSERTEMRPRLPGHLLPVMNDGGGNLYCIDTKVEGLPLVFWDHTLREDQDPEQCATGFAEWLDEQLDQL